MKKYLKIATALLLFISRFSMAQQDVTIKEAFKGDFLIGVAINSRQIQEKDPVQSTLVKREFGILTAENDMKSMNIHPEADRYNFEIADRLIELAGKNKQLVHGHTLIWHSQLSPFFREIKDPEVMKAAFQEHISTIAGRYRGKIYSWDVVNEAVADNGDFRKSVFLNVLGEDYLALAFKLAAQADPEAILYYNDYSLTNPAKRDGVIRMIKKMQESGAKIDGIGMQGHWGLESPTIQEIEESMLAYAALGVKVSITELDIDVLPRPNGVSGAEISQNAELRAELNPYTDGLPKGIADKQTQRYKEIFELFEKHHDIIDRVTFWGVNDGNSWKNGFPVRGRTNYPLLFDRNNERKSAYYAILSIK